MLDIDQHSFQHYRHEPGNPSSLSNNRVYSIYKDRFGTVWVGTDGGGVNRMDAGSDSFVSYQHQPGNLYSLGSDCVMDIVEDASGTLWLGCWGGGLNRYDRDRDRFVSYRHMDNDGSSLGHDYILCLATDTGQNLWIGTDGGGVNKCNPAMHRFVHYRKVPGRAMSLSDNSVRAVMTDGNGHIWIGYYNHGIDRLDRSAGILTHYGHDPQNAASLGNDNVRCFYADSAGFIWIGTYGGGVNRLNPETGIIDRNVCRPTHAHGLKERYVRFIFRDRSGMIWVGGQYGLYRAHAFDGDYVHYTQNADVPGSLTSSNVLSMRQDRKGRIWIGTWGGGLLRYNPARDRFVHVQHDADENTSSGHNLIYTIFEDADGFLWLGTGGGGVYKADIESKTFIRFTEKQGLPSNKVFGILQEDAGTLWISTTKGLAAFDPKTEIFKSYDVRDGLQGNEFDQGAFFQSADGELYFGGVNGLNSFFPARIHDNPHIPPIVMTDFRLFNKSVPIQKTDTDPESPLHQSITETKKLFLSYQDRVFSFTFAALDYVNPGKNRYAYQMQGLDQDWVYCGHRQFVTYTNLNPGRYDFRVKGSNNDGIWNEAGTSLVIIITPPFWKTHWFQGFLVLALAGSVTGIYFWRIRKLTKEKEMHQRFSQRLIEVQEGERKRIAKELHDGLGQNLLIVKNEIDHFIRFQEIEQKEKHDYAEIASLLTQSIDEVRTLSHHLHPHILDRLGLTRAIDSAVRQMAKTGDWHVHQHIENIDHLLSTGNEIHAFRIVQEILNNIIKHARANTVHVEIGQRYRHITLEIRDNGVGFDLADKKVTPGFGLDSLAERVRIVGGTWRIETQPGQGSMIRILIPTQGEKNEPTA